MFDKTTKIIIDYANKIYIYLRRGFFSQTSWSWLWYGIMLTFLFFYLIIFGVALVLGGLIDSEYYIKNEFAPTDVITEYITKWNDISYVSMFILGLATIMYTLSIWFTYLSISAERTLKKYGVDKIK